MILLIDNYDSFVHNLARYCNLCGHDTHIVRNDKINLDDVDKLYSKITHIIISPGPNTPNEAGISLELIKQYYTKLPILGVCLGHQAIGQAFNYNVTNARYPMHGMKSIINHNKQSIFYNLPNPLVVGRYHSLIVEDNINNPPTQELEILAISQEQEIMAIKHKVYNVIGVQFHPESILTTYGLQLIKNFLII